MTGSVSPNAWPTENCTSVLAVPEDADSEVLLIVNVVLIEPVRLNDTLVSVPKDGLNWGKLRERLQSVSVAGMGVVVRYGPSTAAWVVVVIVRKLATASPRKLREIMFFIALIIVTSSLSDLGVKVFLKMS
jgi:hypothetical protein